MVTENKAFTERPNTFPWPPLIYVLALIGGAVLGWLWPLPWFTGMAGEMLFATGILFIVGAIGMDIAAMQTLHSGRTTVLPHRKSEHLITKGVYTFTRNPIYLGNTVLVIGVGLISGIAWYLPLAFIAAYATQKLAIEREEKHLETRFGKAYRDYKKRVKRWI
jgi:protein-S-isoprenylcysteine O-methyltransferase Ste14